MRDLRWCRSRTAWRFLLLAAACLASGAAVAQVPITQYVAVQPIDVCSDTGTNCAPYNATSPVGNVTCLGGITTTTLTITSCSSGTPAVSDTLSSGTLIAPGTIITTLVKGSGTSYTGTVNISQTPPVPAGTTITATGPIGFVVNPTTGVAYPATGGVDITRAMAHQIGIDVIYMPMVTLNSTASQTLNVTQGATCVGSITGTTLTIASCSSGVPSVSDSLSAGTLIASGTIITTLAPGSVQGSYTGTVNNSQTPPVPAGTTITDTSTKFQSQGFLTLSQQPGISGSPPPLVAPAPPLSPLPNVHNMFFINNCVPPPSQMGGQLYDFSWVNRTGTGICGKTFVPTFPATPQTDTLFHGLGHNWGFDHPTFGAGPYEPKSSTNPFPPCTSSSPCGGYVQPPPAAAGTCNSTYPDCMANLMTTGMSRTQPTIACALATGTGATTVPASCAGKPSFNNGTADQLTTVAQENAAALPVSQETKVLGSLSGSVIAGLPASGFLNPIAQSMTMVMDPEENPNAIAVTVTGATGVPNLPNLTLLAMVLQLPPPLMFYEDEDGGGEVYDFSQSRYGLVQDVDFFADHDNAPGGVYYIGSLYNQCISAQCLIVEFNLPGAGTTDGITDQVSFKTNLTTLVTNAELCGASVTFVFSDGSLWPSALACSEGGVPTANSQNPNLTASVQPQIVDQGRFATFTAGKFGCSDTTAAGCSNINDSVLYQALRDGSTTEATAQICHRLGVPIVCPQQ